MRRDQMAGSVFSVAPMHTSQALLCLLAAVAAVLFPDVGTPQLRTQTKSTITALVGGRMIAAPDASPVEDATILIEEGRIATVGPREKVTVPPGARIIDCRNLVFVAGFQNSHVHFTEERWTDAASQPAPKLAAQLQAMLAAYGFVTVVDTGSILNNTGALRRRIEAGEVLGPRILTAGMPLYPPDGVPYYLKDGSIPPDLLRRLPQPFDAERSSVDRR